MQNQNFLNMLFSPQGTLSRFHYIICQLILLFLTICGLILFLYPSLSSLFDLARSTSNDLSWFGNIFMTISGLGLLILCVYMAFVLDIKRLRDVGWSPWLVLLRLIPFPWTSLVINLGLSLLLSIMRQKA